MQTITTIGLDIAKSVFQVHGVDAAGQVVIRRQLKRRYVLAFFQKLPPCLVGIEACASSHHWSRELQALGHTVRLMPPAYVKPYVKRQKNDYRRGGDLRSGHQGQHAVRADQDARATACLMLHRTRHLFIRQQTAVINRSGPTLPNSASSHLLDAEASRHCSEVVADRNDQRLPDIARACLLHWASIARLKKQILKFDRMIMAWHRSNETSRRLDYFPVSVRRWQQLWSRVSLIPRPSDPDATSRPGSGWCRSSTRAEARTGLAVSASKAIAICEACL